LHAAKIAPDKVSVRQIGIRKNSLIEIGASQIRAPEVGKGKVGHLEGAASKIRGCQIGSVKVGVREVYTLQERLRYIHSHQGDLVGVQFLQSFDTTAASPLSLRS